MKRIRLDKKPVNVRQRSTKSPAEAGLSGHLLEEVPEAERGLLVDLVIGCFLRVLHPSHAFPAVPGDDGLLGLPFPFACRPRFEGAFGTRRAHTEFHDCFYK